MKLLQLLRARAETEESYFAKALLLEDITRIEVLYEKAKTAKDMPGLMKDGLYIGWTKGDLRTGELKEFLQPFMASIFALAQGGNDEQAVIDNWICFSRERMRILVHCL
ncbi:hypothetical protein MNBD_ALPHA06-1876 [hydrothermal vent metagenome]|uniref:Uncharacterized protein n=1 Tax=hydrothermal vent metagenome TaxID=652676 RepID=A0A3B0RV90_9ZZZZ